MRVETDAVQHRPARLVAEVHVLEPDVPAQGAQLAFGTAPGPFAGLAAGLAQFTAGLLDAHEDGPALVRFRPLIQDLENALGPGEGGEKEVRLLRELVYRRRRLADEHQVTGETARVRHAAQCHDAAQDGHDGVINIRDADHGGDHRRGVALRAGTREPERLVFLLELGHGSVLVVKDLHDLLAVDELLNVAVQLSEAGLLTVVVHLAPLPAEADVEKHRGVADGDDEGEPPVEDEEQRKRAGHLDETLDDHGEAVVESIRYGVHVVGEIAHDVAPAAAVEPA